LPKFACGQRRTQILGDHDVQQCSKIIGGHIMSAREVPPYLIRLGRDGPYVGGDDRFQRSAVGLGHRHSIAG